MSGILTAEDKINCTIAEKLFGWKWYRCTKRNYRMFVCPENDPVWDRWNFFPTLTDDNACSVEPFNDWNRCSSKELGACSCKFGPPDYCNDLNEAYLAVRKLNELGYRFDMEVTDVGFPESKYGCSVRIYKKDSNGHYIKPVESLIVTPNADEFCKVLASAIVLVCNNMK